MLDQASVIIVKEMIEKGCSEEEINKFIEEVEREYWEEVLNGE